MKQTAKRASQKTLLPPVRNRKNDPGQMKYLLENVPRDLIVKAKAKGRAQDPPVSVKWVLIKLLEQWVNGARKI